MDYSNERWVRLYTRDTATWKLVDWRARTVLLHILRKADRAGVIDVGKDGELGLAALLELPREIVADGLRQLLERETVLATGSAYVLPNFLEAQEAPATDKQRQRDSRGNRRARAMRDAAMLSVTNRDSASRNVTECHARSQDVTSGHSTQPNKTQHEPDLLSGKPDAPVLKLFAEQPAEPDGAMMLAKTCCDALAEFAGRKYRPESIATVELARKLAKKRVTPEQVRSVVEAMSAKWRGDSKMDEYLRPSTLLAPGKFFAYLDDLGAGGSVSAAGRAPGPVDTFSQRRRLDP